MVIYESIRHLLAWSVIVATLGAVTFPWGMLAYKVWHGNKAIDEEFREELLRRSWYMGWLLACAAPVFLVLDHMTVVFLGMPPGPIHFVYYVGFLALAGWAMMFFFSLEDILQGLILAVIYLYMPTALLFLLWLITRWNPVFEYVLTWLKEPPA